MKLLKPLKYVITAAAVCILCFSGNGEYFYAIFAVTPENDIVEQPQQNGFSNGKLIRKNNELCVSSINKRYIRKCNIVLCRTLSFSNNCYNNTCCNAFSIDLPALGRQGTSVSESRILYELFSVKHPGNRSP